MWEHLTILNKVINLSCLGILPRISFLTKPLVSVTFFSVSVTFVLRASILTKPVILYSLFPISVVFVFKAVLLTSPPVLIVSLSLSSIFFSIFYISEPYYVLKTKKTTSSDLVS